MRKLAQVLTVLAALSFFAGIVRVLFGRVAAGFPGLGYSPETFWRGATGLVLFAIVVLMLERSQPK